MKRMIMKYKGYTTKVYYTKDYNVYYGRFEGVSDLISFEGNTIEDFKKAFEEAVDHYFELCNEIGKEPSIPYKDD